MGGMVQVDCGGKHTGIYRPMYMEVDEREREMGADG